MTSLSIVLEGGFSPKVKQGDKVISGQVIAVKSTVGNNHEINLFHILGIKSHSGNLLVKKPGDKIEQGGVVAIKKGTLGMGSKKAVSPVNGTVFEFDKDSGILIIRTTEESKVEDLFSPVDGEVEVCDNDKIVIKTQESGAPVIQTVGDQLAEGELFVVSVDEVEASDIKLEIKGKILAGKKFSREALAKSLGLGARGVITAEISEEDLADLKSKMITTPIFVVSDEEISKISKKHGVAVHLDPTKKTILFLKK